MSDGAHGRACKALGSGRSNLVVTGAAGVRGSRLGSAARGGRIATATVRHRRLRGIVLGAEGVDLVGADVLSTGVASIGGNALAEELHADVEGHGLLVVLDTGHRGVGRASALPFQVDLAEISINDSACFHQRSKKHTSEQVLVSALLLQSMLQVLVWPWHHMAMPRMSTERIL